MGMEAGTRPRIETTSTSSSQNRETHNPRSSEPSGAAPGGGIRDIRQPTFGQGIVVSAVISVAMLVLAITAIRRAESTGLPLTETTGPLYWGLAVVAVIAAGIGAQHAERTAARAAAAIGHPRDGELMETAWAVPAVATAGSAIMIATYHNTAMLICGPIMAFFGIAGALLSRDLLDDVTEPTQRTAMAIHTFVIGTIAFLALGAVYINKIPSPISAPLIGIFSGLLILETLERGIIFHPTRVAYSVIGGMLMAECMVMLNWWPTHGWTGGAVLLVCFYLISSALLERTRRTALRPRDFIEFGLIGFIGIILLAITA